MSLKTAKLFFNSLLQTHIYQTKIYKMKQKFLSILSLVMITAVTANAQVATNYRGAFAPAPVAQWTDNWTNWDPQNTFYPAPTDSVQGIITTNQTWTKNKVYMLKGLVYIDSLVTLTIEPGTVVLGDHRTVISTLVVQRGGKLIANGTACNPIVFSSTRAAGSRQRGDWGGITILGRAVSNRGLNNPVEGIAPDVSTGRLGKEFFGGTDDNDNSGSLRYVRIEFAGYTLLANQELNSLTMGSVGRGTTIEYIQTSFGNDDAFEWFGGTVNCKYLVAYKTTDDDLDVDQGYSGTVQFALAIKDPARSDVSQSEGFETDNNASTPFTVTPRTSAKFYNVTQIGGFRCSSNAGSIVEPTGNLFRKGARFRRGSKLELYNSILMNNYIGLEMTKEGGTAFVDGVFQNNIIAMDTSFAGTLPDYTAKAKFANDTATANYLNAAANRNTVIGTPCDMLANAWNESNPDFRPNAIGSGAALAGADLTPSIDIDGGGLLLANTQVDMIVNIFENAVGNSNGTITVTIPVPAAFPVTVPGLTLTSTPQSGTNGNFTSLGADYFNGDWLFSRVGGNLIATSKIGVKVDQNGSTALGFKVSRPASGTPSGTPSFVSSPNGQPPR
jgi:hypothetical protein